jgi:hypothetical protein
MTRVLTAVAAVLMLLGPAWAWACDGAAGRDVAITTDSQKVTVTNTGREWVQVAFAAFGTNYSLQLAPGQSDSPRSPGMFSQPMLGYQSCVATPLAVSSGVSALRSGR